MSEAMQSPAAQNSRSITFDEAIVRYRTGEREGLLDPIAAALLSGAGDPRLWNLQGLILRDLDRREEALECLRKAAQMAPTSARIAHALARTLYETGLPSLEAYGQALRLAPTDTEVLAGMTSAFVAEGEVDAAMTGLDRILSRSPQWIEGHVLLAKLRWAQGERDQFARSFEAATAALPQMLDLWREWILALMHAEQWDEVLRAIGKGRAATGEQSLFAANDAIVFAERGGAFERAEAMLAPFADLNDATVQVRRVRHYLRWGRPEEADRIMGQWTDRPEAFMFWPYASVAWRMLDDPRWEWLEGDDRFVGVYDIADRLPPLDVLADTLRRLHTLSSQPLEQSLRGGTQTDGDIFMHIDPVLVHLREAIRTTVADHAAKLPPHQDGHPLLGRPREPIRFSGAWSVRLQSGGYHANHVHPAGWISSALYIVLPPDLGRDDAGFLTLGEAKAPTFQVDLPPFRTVEPRPGRLVLFPSYMWHGTRPFGEGERLTVAFDVAVPRVG
jgi:tetratricopeptide (TPR) repeat protein